MGVELLKLTLLFAVVITAGCSDLNSTPSNNETQDINPAATYTYTEEDIRNVELNLSDIEKLDFHSNVKDHHTYIEGWSKPILFDNYAGTKEEKLGFKLYDKERETLDYAHTEYPIAIETSAYRFENPGRAIKKMKDIIEKSDDVGSSDVVSNEGTFYSRELKIESGTRLKISSRYERENNVILIATTANYERYMVDETEQLITAMVGKLNSK